MKKNKILTIVLLALGAAIILAGFIILCQGGTSHTGHSGGVTRASTSIKFGADFYTSSAQYTALAANAVSDLYKLTSTIAGLFFMFVGLVEVTVTLLLTDIKEMFKKEEVVEEVVAEAAEPAEIPAEAEE